MIKDARLNKFNIILVHKLDRFARNREDAVTYKALLKKHGVDLYSVTEKLKDDMYGKLIEGVLEAVSEFHSLNMAEEIRRGQMQSIKRGYLGAGPPPYGYRAVRDGDKRRLEIDPETAPVIKKLFEMSAAGRSMKDILIFINSSPLKPKRADKWVRKTLRLLLKDENLIGVRKYRGEKIENAHPPIISKELFLKSKAQRDKNKKKQNPERKIYHLAGVSTCARCGSIITTKSSSNQRGNKYKFYLCNYVVDKSLFNKDGCIRKHIKAEEIEEKVKEIVIEKLKNYNLNKALLEKAKTKDTGKKDKEKIKLLKKEFTEIQEQKENIINAIASGISHNHFKEKLDALAERKEEIEKEMNKKTKSSRRKVSPGSLAKLLEKASPLQLRKIYKEQIAVKLDLIERTGKLQIKYFYPEDCWFDFTY